MLSIMQLNKLRHFGSAKTVSDAKQVSSQAQLGNCRAFEFDRSWTLNFSNFTNVGFAV
jgi:hypothetical protein